MLIKHKPDAYEKLQALSGMSTDDVLDRSQSQARFTASPTQPRFGIKRQPIPGVYKAAMPNGKYISLMRTMFTDFCMLDCAYCPNSIYVPRKRVAFTVDELSRLFMQYVDRHLVDGLFLSSGIAGSPDKTMDKMVQVVEAIRKKYGYKGYIHLKVMPGTSRPLVEEAFRLGSRLSVNIETPSAEMMERISPHKPYQTWILDQMSWINDLIRNRYGENGAVGQATQFVVGAADETDWDILQRVRQLYKDWNLKRVYYQGFIPARHTPLEEHPATLPIREHRLYQLDWLTRVYKFKEEELKLSFDDRGFLYHEVDPKTMIAAHTLEAGSVDINAASRDDLIRVPGIGPLSTERILRQRRYHSIDSWRDLKAMGVVRKRAEVFLRVSGERPQEAQLKLPLFQQEREGPLSGVAAPATPGPVGVVKSGCAGCPVACGGSVCA